MVLVLAPVYSYNAYRGSVFLVRPTFWAICFASNKVLRNSIEVLTRSLLRAFDRFVSCHLGPEEKKKRKHHVFAVGWRPELWKLFFLWEANWTQQWSLCFPPEPRWSQLQPSSMPSRRLLTWQPTLEVSRHEVQTGEVHLFSLVFFCYLLIVLGVKQGELLIFL